MLYESRSVFVRARVTLEEAITIRLQSLLQTPYKFSSKAACNVSYQLLRLTRVKSQISASAYKFSQ
jgi:hypothetical protein